LIFGYSAPIFVKPLGTVARTGPGRGFSSRSSESKLRCTELRTLLSIAYRSRASAAGLLPAGTNTLQPHRVETFKLSTDSLFFDKVDDIIGPYLIFGSLPTG
jgi:hypothetical protein